MVQNMSRWYVTSSKIFVLPTSVTRNSRIVSHYYVKSTKMCTYAHQCDTKWCKLCHTTSVHPSRLTSASLPHKVHNVSRWYVTSSIIFVLPTSVTRNSRIVSHYHVKSTKMCTFAHQCDTKCHKSCHTSSVHPSRPTAAYRSPPPDSSYPSQSTLFIHHKDIPHPIPCGGRPSAS